MSSQTSELNGTYAYEMYVAQLHLHFIDWFLEVLFG
jgi:hypothetical protein